MLEAMRRIHDRLFASALPAGLALVLAAAGALVPVAGAAGQGFREAQGARAAQADPGRAGQICRGTVYLTLDTGNMRDAELIAATLTRHRVRATFFLANEKTVRGDHALDDGWRDWWRARAAEGHAFGSHTMDHVYFSGAAGDRVRAKPQFGAQAGREQRWDAGAVCAEIARVDARFRELAGRPLDAIWRAPGGRLPEAVDRFATECGWSHVPWTPAGFLGDELPSEKFPNDRLLARQLKAIGDGDILIAHLGIWSRKDPYAPMLDPLIAGLKAKGMCFATIPEHPRWRKADGPAGRAAGDKAGTGTALARG
ncbi:polysaccharide deacetylase family protein [Burkholderiaceae bacterium FT117]|uniref:polysaccharide deacetylase family protein n=1 Tax=Zeimonas sediminis TaxID=2944268 RepID=UPI0023430106|nr:polysaccharide deacetylase family protein [Zeimonas sediminis]MCM5569767.1 polysaccharide deacetylase family protein [Zeimonas sediminis]